MICTISSQAPKGNLWGQDCLQCTGKQHYTSFKSESISKWGLVFLGYNAHAQYGIASMQQEKMDLLVWVSE